MDVFFQLYLPTASYIAMQLYSATPSDIVLRTVRCSPFVCANKGARTLDTSLKIANVLRTKLALASLLFYHFVNAGIVNMGVHYPKNLFLVSKFLHSFLQKARTPQRKVFLADFFKKVLTNLVGCCRLNMWLVTTNRNIRQSEVK